MQVKVLIAFIAVALVAGLPEPDPEPDPNTKFDVKVDAGDSQLDGYVGVVKTAGKTTFKLMTKLLGQAMGYKCCKVKVAFKQEYVEYENGATDVPCGGRLAGVNGTCVDGNVVCEIDNMGVVSNEITLKVDNEKTNENETIMIHLVPESSLYDAMIIAKQDKELRFTYTLSQGGVLIQSIDGVGPDITGNWKWGWIWYLYNCTAACTPALKGVSETYPHNGDIWTWRYEFKNWTTPHSD